MSKPPDRNYAKPGEEDWPEPKAPNLFLLYCFLALGLLAAMAFAAMIVYPFHLRH